MGKKRIPIKIKKLKAQPWAFRKLRDSASNANLTDNQVLFGLPKQSQIIWPGRPVRLCTGWKLESMPKQSQMTTTPHKQLLANNLISLPQWTTVSQVGSQISQVVLNNGPQPVKIQILNDQPPKLVKLHPQTLMVIQQLQFNFGNFINGVLTAGTQIATLFA